MEKSTVAFRCPAPPQVDTLQPSSARVAAETAPVVWVNSASQLIGEALAALLGANRAVAAAAQPPNAAGAVWDLRTLAPPYPPPPDVPTLALVPRTEAAKLAVLNVGYRGYLSGEETALELRRAVDAVLGGEVWAERHILGRLVRTPRPPSLTAREQQTLHLLVQGLANKEIARQLEIAEKTVKVYVSELLYKFGVKTRVDLALRHRREQVFREPFG